MTLTPQEQEAMAEADKSYDHPHIYPQHQEVTVLAALVRRLLEREKVATAWHPFNPSLGSGQRLPAKYQPVLVRVPENKERGTPEGIAVGYLKFGAGDPESPYFVTPGIGGNIEAWCDVLPWREVAGRNAVYEMWEASRLASLSALNPGEIE